MRVLRYNLVCVSSCLVDLFHVLVSKTGGGNSFSDLCTTESDGDDECAQPSRAVTRFWEDDFSTYVVRKETRGEGTPKWLCVTPGVRLYRALKSLLIDRGFCACIVRLSSLPLYARAIPLVSRHTYLPIRLSQPFG